MDTIDNNQDLAIECAELPASSRRLRHYEIECRLADRLRNATREERRHLYATVYDELFRRVPWHSQLQAKQDVEARDRDVEQLLFTLQPFLNPQVSYAEIGAGDCALALRVAQHVRDVCAIDVSSEITAHLATPPNFRLVLSDGTSIPTTADFIFSNQLMEHLHPDDAIEQLREVYRALMPGGVYLCITPSRMSGPHDVSRHFDGVAKGLHLKEYTARELASMFKAAGFDKVAVYLRIRQMRLRAPLWPVVALEMALRPLPHRLRRRICSLPGVRRVLGVLMLGYKSP